jgi:lipopolysaccharide transport system ATP-binding protein
MSDVALRVEKLGKRFRIQSGGRGVASYRTARDLIANTVMAPFRRRTTGAEPDERDYWALKDVSFEVKKGEVVGLIGRNGAGKSTLLKVLSRITEPTEGYAEISGRVGSLLEVGTGFHPELSGRENVFLNGAILGMTRSEIAGKFDEIVGFAEMDKFIDSPVKFYSSGMFVRLAFAVAAHLEPEILFVDEVLAVGDAAFQKKCLGKMQDVAQSGRTVILVSHNMGAIAELCTHGVLLDYGKVAFAGTVGLAIEGYGKLLGANKGIFELEDRGGRFSLLSVAVANDKGEPTANFDIRDEVRIMVTYRLREAAEGMDLALTLSRNFIPIFNTHDTDHLPALPRREPGVYCSTMRIPRAFLKAGHYSLRIASGVPAELFADYDGVAEFDVEELSEDTKNKGYRQARLGHIIAPVSWEWEQVG